MISIVATVLPVLRRSVVLVLLAVWSFPAAGMASSGNETAQSAPRGAQSSGRSSVQAPAAPAEAQQYAERERQARELENFRGGDVGIYIGGGALTIVLIVLLILLLV
jgi:hypothetical protein